MAKDVIGNELREGDLVMYQLPAGTTHIRCRVGRIQDGGISMLASGSEAQDAEVGMTPGVVSMTTLLESQFDPRTGIVVTLHKLQDPAKQKTGLLAN